MPGNVVVAGAAMTPFVKPSTSDTYDVLGSVAARAALKAAGVEYSDVQQVYAGYVYGDSCSGQRVVYNLGMTGVPVFNQNNNCATGSCALYLARQAIEAGIIDVALVVGFEQMRPGALDAQWGDRPDPLGRFVDLTRDWQPQEDTPPPAPHMFGGAGVEYAKKYGTSPEIFAHISVKARRHAKHNDKAIFRDPVTVQEVMDSPHIYGVLTRLQCCPPTCGGAAAVLVSEAHARRKGLDSSVVIRAQTMHTDFSTSFDDRSLMELVGYGMTRAAARQTYEASGIGPDDVDVVELHDCFTANELITYEGLGLTPEGTAERFILDGDNTYGGKVVTNPSGGLLSKGHPLGATGVAQCVELTEQLRGQSGRRQVEGARIGLQHNVGIGGACVVTMYERQTHAA